MSRTGAKLRGSGESFFIMNTWVYFFGAIVTLSVSLLLRKNTEPYCDCGAEAYTWRRVRRVVGTVLLVVAAIACIIGVLAFLVSPSPADLQPD
jgi:hypothetical protein